MNNEDKPFPCTIGSCKQRFANADHLHVHCIKHEMSLKSLDTPIINLDDTTPTPTRFLKNENTADDGLFTDLVPSANPFDLEFKKASEKRRMSQEASSVQTIPSLETPDSKQIEGDSGLGSEPILESVSETVVGDVTTSVSVAPSVPASQESVVANPLPVDDAVEMITAEGNLQVVETAASEGDAISLSSGSQHYGSQEFLPSPPGYDPPAPAAVPTPVTSVIQTQPSVQHVITQILPQQPQLVRAPNPLIPAQAMAPLQAQASSLNSIVNSLPTNITAPLLIKLPDGQQIRVVPSVVANPSAPVPVAISANQKSARPGAPQSTGEAVNYSDGKRAIKERLKETLLSNQNHGNMNVMAKAVEVRMREQQQVVKQEGKSYTIIAGTAKQEEAPSPVSGNKRSSDEDDDPDFKRQKFLERNRAAASRCREKKKQWVTNLESKAENLTVTNVKLNNEILTLKNEVAHLKQLLLAHKDCPVTQMQQRQSQNWQVFHSIKESEEEIQSTKSGTAVSAPNSEETQTTVTEVSSTSPEGAILMRSLSQSMRDAVRELTSAISDGGTSTITMEGGVPTVIIN